MTTIQLTQMKTHEVFASVTERREMYNLNLEIRIIGKTQYTISNLLNNFKKSVSWTLVFRSIVEFMALFSLIFTLRIRTLKWWTANLVHLTGSLVYSPSFIQHCS